MMNARTAAARAMAIDAARPVLRAHWGAWSSDRLASWCHISAKDVRDLAREMGLAVKARPGRRAA